MAGEELSGMHSTLEFLLRHGYVVLPESFLRSKSAFPYLQRPFFWLRAR